MWNVLNQKFQRFSFDEPQKPFRTQKKKKNNLRSLPGCVNSSSTYALYRIPFVIKCQRYDDKRQHYVQNISTKNKN